MSHKNSQKNVKENDFKLVHFARGQRVTFLSKYCKTGTATYTLSNDGSSRYWLDDETGQVFDTGSAANNLKNDETSRVGWLRQCQSGETPMYYGGGSTLYCLKPQEHFNIVKSADDLDTNKKGIFGVLPPLLNDNGKKINPLINGPGLYYSQLIQNNKRLKDFRYTVFTNSKDGKLSYVLGLAKPLKDLSEANRDRCKKTTLKSQHSLYKKSMHVWRLDNDGTKLQFFDSGWPNDKPKENEPNSGNEWDVTNTAESFKNMTYVFQWEPPTNDGSESVTVCDNPDV
jgi:hypothetical protein